MTMFDPFGLRKEIEPAEHGPAQPEDPAEAAPSGRRRLWAVLLLLDTVFLFVFGGALAGMLYLRRMNPPNPPRPVVVAHKPKPKPETPASDAAASAAGTQAKKPEPPPPRAKDGPAGSPSVHAPSLPRRNAEPLGQGASKTPEARPAAAEAPDGRTEKARAVPVEFTHRAPGARQVVLKAPFLVRTSGKKAMTKGEDGVWKLTVSLLPGAYKYHFVVDGKRIPAETVDVP